MSLPSAAGNVVVSMSRDLPTSRPQWDYLCALSLIKCHSGKKSCSKSNVQHLICSITSNYQNSDVRKQHVSVAWSIRTCEPKWDHSNAFTSQLLAAKTLFNPKWMSGKLPKNLNPLWLWVMLNEVCFLNTKSGVEVCFPSCFKQILTQSGTVSRYSCLCYLMNRDFIADWISDLLEETSVAIKSIVILWSYASGWMFLATTQF